MSKSSQRLDGFELLQLIGAPAPQYQIIKSQKDVDSMRTWQVKHGWSIRSCRIDGVREMGLFYKNYVQTSCLADELSSAISTFSSTLFFLVYPSWRFRFSCNVVVSDFEVFVEGKFGSQKGVAMGTELADFSLRIPFGFRSMTEVLAGHLNEDVESRLGQLIHYTKKSQLSYPYAEAALKEDGDLVFYDLFDLKRSVPFSVLPRRINIVR